MLRVTDGLQIQEKAGNGMLECIWRKKEGDDPATPWEKGNNA
jgi:hypothetical protein